MENTINLKHGAWYKDAPVTYNFPENWDVEIFSVKKSPVLDIRQVRSNIDNPVGAEKIRILAKPGMKVLLISDDIVRPTRTDIVIPVLIEMLLEAGVRKEDISILISSGTHNVMTRDEIDLKFGKATTAHFRVYTHDYRKGNKFVGKTTQGTPVFLNKRVVSSDLVIGIGGIYPHEPAGFGGGAKLILGVCGMSTILHFHRRRSGSGIGGDINNDFRRDISDAARLAHMDFIVNTVINGDRDIIELVAGDTEKAYLEGIRRARTLLSVPDPDSGSYDLVIADVYPIDSTYTFMQKGWWPVWSVKYDCFRLVIASMPKGAGGHMLFPLKRDPQINKIRLRYFEFKAFGTVYFINKIVVPKLRSILKKIRSKIMPPAQARVSAGSEKYKNATIRTRELAILHYAEGKAKQQLETFPHMVFDDQNLYYQHISAITGNRPLKVALYKNSSLTYPISKVGESVD